MKKAEKIFAILVLTGLTFKFFLIPLGGTILTLSTMSLAMLYYIFGFAFFNQVELKNIFKKEAYKDSSVLKIAGAIVTGIGISTTSLGILFKIQKWPLANENILAGLFFIIIVSVISFIKLLKNKNLYYKRILIRTIIAFVFGVLFLRLSGYEITKIEFRNYPDYVKAYELSIANPNNDSLQFNLDLERKKTYMDPETYAAYQKMMKNQRQK